MSKHIKIKNEQKISKISIAVVFVALLINTFLMVRVGIQNSKNLSIVQIQPYLIGASSSMISCLLMIFLHDKSKHKLVLLVGALTIVLLFGFQLYMS